jgi:hypothetical protein
MSILLHVPAPVKKLVAKSKHVEPTTSSILLISVLLPNTMKQYNTCRDKIVGFEQSGIYTNSEQFKLSLSYCGTS